MLGSSPLRNALAGLTGVLLTALFALWAGIPGHPWAAAPAIAAGAYARAVFHGLRGAFRLSAAAGRPTPATPASQDVRDG